MPHSVYLFGRTYGSRLRQLLRPCRYQGFYGCSKSEKTTSRFVGVSDFGHPDAQHACLTGGAGQATRSIRALWHATARTLLSGRQRGG